MKHSQVGTMLPFGSFASGATERLEEPSGLKIMKDLENMIYEEQINDLELLSLKRRRC